MKNLKIVTWNCNGAFRRKFNFIDEFDADIYVIQECENPTETGHLDYIEWAQNYLWKGDSKHKGLGIFAREGISLELLDWTNIYEDNPLKYLLTCRVNSEFSLIAVWTHYNKSPTFGYIGQFWKYLQLHKSNFKNCLIVGDFNSNSIWDKPKRAWNHSEVVRELEEINITSLYHFEGNQTQGNEEHPTFFLQKNSTNLTISITFLVVQDSETT
ncbi:exonuclease/endonuclease/phosphatase family protein [Algoriphagus aquimarinus]|uniref:endonuclease/exonuclease/phosphatase family protein n=1 Tax=Algoriphagus aquimarinus TaxID=237018 RepID=UPI001C311C23|nr:endonuclease/exonuclease/phosphatase family protein [Algoriphagus aquimarinus]